MKTFEYKRQGKAQHPDLPAVVVDTVLKRLHRSFANFFRGLKEGAPQPLPTKDNAIGLDMGIRYLIADSDGHIVANPKFGQQTTARLAHAQQCRAKYKQGSHRRWKAKKTIAIEHMHVANMVRNHHLALR